MLKARSYEEGSVHSLNRSDVIDESENQKLKTGRTDRLQGRRNNWRQID